MTLPVAPNSISLLQIQTEFGGTSPISLQEYYKGGAYVSSSVVASIPISGAISFQVFRGASAVVRPLVSQVSVQASEGPTTFSFSITVYTSTTNTTGTAQQYQVNMYYIGQYYTTINVQVLNGSSSGTYSQPQYAKSANYGPVSPYSLYGICESVTSNTVYMASQYDSSPPPISYIELTGSWGGTGARTIYITYNVYLTRLNLTGSSITYPLVVINTDSPDLAGNSSIDVTVNNGSSAGSAPTSFSSVNIGFQHYITTQATGASGTITSINSAYYQAGY